MFVVDYGYSFFVVLDMIRFFFLIVVMVMV